MASKSIMPLMEFYKDNSRLKWVILVVSVVISIGSIYYTNILVDQLKQRERDQVKLFARTLEYVLNETDNNITFITEEIIYKNNSIPTIVVDDKGSVLDIRNISIDSTQSNTKIHEQLDREILGMQKDYEPIIIQLKDPTNNDEVFGRQ